MVANRSGRLSQGALVEASILARVLGLRLLTLDATLVVVPADVAPAARPRGLSVLTPVRSSEVAPPQSHIVGLGLTDAVRNINEGAELSLTPDTTAPEEASMSDTETAGAAISRACVQILREYSGRGPTEAKTTISDGTVVVALGGALTTLNATWSALEEPNRSKTSVTGCRWRCATT